MSRLVGDYVVREAGKDHAARQVRGNIGGGRREVTEEQRLLVRAVIGIRLSQSVRVDAQPSHVLLVPVPSLAAFFPAARGPEGAPAKGALEVADGGHRHGVHHLLVELRVAFRWLQAIGREEVWLVEVYRRIDAAAGRVG